jgi:hypothetical protein
MADSYKRGIEVSGSMKCWEYHEWSSNCWFSRMTRLLGVTYRDNREIIVTRTPCEPVKFRIHYCPYTAKEFYEVGELSKVSNVLKSLLL